MLTSPTSPSIKTEEKGWESHAYNWANEPGGNSSKNLCVLKTIYIIYLQVVSINDSGSLAIVR